MSDAPDQRLLEALLDSWDRNNIILVNLLRALPEGGLERGELLERRVRPWLFVGVDPVDWHELLPKTTCFDCGGVAPLALERECILVLSGD